MRFFQRVLGFLVLFLAWLFLMGVMLSPHSFGQSNGAGLMPAVPQFFDNNGAILASGWVCSYATGTTTPQNTYTDATAGTPNADPYQLDASGRGYAWLAAGLVYRIAIYANGTGNTCNGTTVGTLIKQLDGVSAQASGSYGFISGTGSIVQLASAVKIVWGASGANPAIDGTTVDNTLSFWDGTVGYKWYNNVASTVEMELLDAGALSVNGTVRFGSNGSTGGGLLSGGTPTIGTCGTGAITSGSVDSGGEATATGATSCTVNFSTTFAAAPFCVATDETTAAALKISAISTSAFTVAGLTSSDKFMWVCIAR